MDYRMDFCTKNIDIFLESEMQINTCIEEPDMQHFILFVASKVDSV